MSFLQRLLLLLLFPLIPLQSFGAPAGEKSAVLDDASIDGSLDNDDGELSLDDEDEEAEESFSPIISDHLKKYRHGYATLGTAISLVNLIDLYRSGRITKDYFKKMLHSGQHRSTTLRLLGGTIAPLAVAAFAEWHGSQPAAPATLSSEGKNDFALRHGLRVKAQAKKILEHMEETGKAPSKKGKYNWTLRKEMKHEHATAKAREQAEKEISAREIAAADTINRSLRNASKFPRRVRRRKEALSDAKNELESYKDTLKIDGPEGARAKQVFDKSQAAVEKQLIKDHNKIMGKENEKEETSKLTTEEIKALVAAKRTPEGIADRRRSNAKANQKMQKMAQEKKKTEKRADASRRAEALSLHEITDEKVATTNGLSLQKYEPLNDTHEMIYGPPVRQIQKVWRNAFERSKHPESYRGTIEERRCALKQDPKDSQSFYDNEHAYVQAKTISNRLRQKVMRMEATRKATTVGQRDRHKLETKLMELEKALEAFVLPESLDASDAKTAQDAETTLNLLHQKCEKELLSSACFANEAVKSENAGQPLMSDDGKWNVDTLQNQQLEDKYNPSYCCTLTYSGDRALKPFTSRLSDLTITYAKKQQQLVNALENAGFEVECRWDKPVENRFTVFTREKHMERAKERDDLEQEIANLRAIPHQKEAELCNGLEQQNSQAVTCVLNEMRNQLTVVLTKSKSHPALIAEVHSELSPEALKGFRTKEKDLSHCSYLSFEGDATKTPLLYQVALTTKLYATALEEMVKKVEEAHFTVIYTKNPIERTDEDKLYFATLTPEEVMMRDDLTERLQKASDEIKKIAEINESSTEQPNLQFSLLAIHDCFINSIWNTQVLAAHAPLALENGGRAPWRQGKGWALEGTKIGGTINLFGRHEAYADLAPTDTTLFTSRPATAAFCDLWKTVVAADARIRDALYKRGFYAQVVSDGGRYNVKLIPLTAVPTQHA